jgi:hypothetical protein
MRQSIDVKSWRNESIANGIIQTGGGREGGGVNICAEIWRLKISAS